MEHLLLGSSSLEREHQLNSAGGYKQPKPRHVSTEPREVAQATSAEPERKPLCVVYFRPGRALSEKGIAVQYWKKIGDTEAVYGCIKCSILSPADTTIFMSSDFFPLP